MFLSLIGLKERMAQRGVFDGHNVDGIQYADAQGKTSWKINIWPERDSKTCYWVKEGKFFGLMMQILEPPIDRPHYDIGEELSSVPEAERIAIFKAIKKWEEK